MRIRRQFLTIIYLLSFFISGVQAQDVAAKWITEESDEDPALNEYLHLETVRLEISHSPKKVIVWPTFKDSIGGFEILEAGKVDTTFFNDDLISRSQSFLLMAQGNGQLALPPIEFKSLENGSERTYAVRESFVDVSTQAIDTTESTKALKDIQKIPVSVGEWLPWVGIGLVIIGLIVFGIWYYRKRKNNEPLFVPAPPPIPAHEIAMRELSKIEAKKLWQNGYVKEYYVELTDVLRNYIEKRFKVPAMESISDDILKSLKGEKLKPVMLQGLSDLLTRSDLAKFAKSQPDPGENLQSIDFARTFIKESKNMMTLWEEELKRQEEESTARKEGIEA